MSRRILLLAILTATLVVPLAAPAFGHREDPGRCSTACEIERGRSVVVSSPADSHREDAAQCSAECQADVERARSVTAKYRDEKMALRDGFAPATRCESMGRENGAMGMHYLNGARFSLPHQPSVEAPEVLLYIPEATGTLRLVGVEYAVAVFQDGMPYYGIDPPDPARINPPPVLFGHSFDGPMQGHVPGMPWHYDLHVWAWSHNPRGTFAQHNPREACSPNVP
jgi:hypothetical protein